MRSIREFFKPSAPPLASERPQQKDEVDQEPKTPPKAFHEDAAVTGINVPAEEEEATTTESTEDGDDFQSRQFSNVPEQLSEPIAPDPILRSSNITVRKGETVIRNSDDESDSDVLMDELDRLFAKQTSPTKLSSNKKAGLSPKPADLISTQHTKNNNSSGKGIKKKKLTHEAKSQQITPRYKFSLESLVKQTEKDNALESGVVQANNMVAALERAGVTGDAKPPAGLSELLASVAEKDGETGNVDRLMQAVQRTEALHQEVLWHFIEQDLSEQHGQEEEFPFPEAMGSCKKIFGNPPDRLQAFLSGYVGEIALKGQLSSDVLSWLIKATCLEPSEHLRDAYRATIVDSADQLTPLMTPSTLTDLFRELGALEDALDLNKTAVPLARRVPISNSNVPLPWSKVLSLLSLLEKTALYLSTEARVHTLCLLCRLSLDADLLRGNGLVIMVEDAFTSLATTAPVDEVEQVLSAVLTKTFPHVNDHHLRYRLVSSIPASSSRLNLFRQRLSLAFFYEDELPLIKAQEDLVDLTEIAIELEKSRFAISATANYPRLTAMISILDIGIGDGNPPNPEMGPKAEELFNHKVDYLADSVKSMFTRIIDTGASHMLRTQAKDALELLRYRLTWAVRTKPKPRQGIFDSHRTDLESMGLGIENYFQRIEPVNKAEDEMDAVKANAVEEEETEADDSCAKTAMPNGVGKEVKGLIGT
ncbi:MAG: hypothetical protein MMC33_005706 [Icmadophila ericetorum]|nr:hypothetical protein [Icmadophila ericetorum]